MSAITEKRDVGPYEVALSTSLLGFWDGDYVSQLPHVCYYVVVSGFKYARENASTRGPMWFWCLMLRLLGPCELLFLLCFIASWT